MQQTYREADDLIVPFCYEETALNCVLPPIAHSMRHGWGVLGGGWVACGEDVCVRRRRPVGRKIGGALEGHDCIEVECNGGTQME